MYNRSLWIFGTIFIGLFSAVYSVASDNFSVIDSSTKPSGEYSQERLINSRFMRAVMDGDLVSVRDLVSKGADIKHRDEYGATPLIVATMMNHIDVSKFLILKGAKIDDHSYDGSNPLQNAILFDHVALVKLLLRRGASLEMKGRYGWNAVETAENRKRKKVLKYFETEKILTAH